MPEQHLGQFGPSPGDLHHYKTSESEHGGDGHPSLPPWQLEELFDFPSFPEANALPSSSAAMSSQHLLASQSLGYFSDQEAEPYGLPFPADFALSELPFSGSEIGATQAQHQHQSLYQHQYQNPHQHQNQSQPQPQQHIHSQRNMSPPVQSIENGTSRSTAKKRARVTKSEEAEGRARSADPRAPQRALSLLTQRMPIGHALSTADALTCTTSNCFMLTPLDEAPLDHFKCACFCSRVRKGEKQI